MALLELKGRASASDAATTRRWPNYRTPYRPDVEGLRAIAVMTVIGFHATILFMSGGFVGVDVFFVISGFLITSLMLTEAADSGRISLAEFYARRARRILPAAGLVIGVTAIASWLLVPMLRVRDIAQDLAMSALYVSNLRFISIGTDYLAQNRAPSPLLHYWSLAVEEQFYMVWPLVIVGVIALGRRVRIPKATVIALIMFALTAGSFALSLHLTHSQPALAYMASYTRAWQFGAGALIACVSPWLAKKSFARKAMSLPLGWIGVAAVVWATVAFTGKTPYPGLPSLVPTLGTAAVLLSGTCWANGSGPTVGYLLSTRPMRGLGRLSYSWYLWHWPVLVLVEAKMGELSWPERALLMMAAAVPAWFTLRLIERPIRFSRAANARPSSGLSVGIISSVVALTVALAAGSLATRSVEQGTSLGSISLASVFDPAMDAKNSGGVSPNTLAVRMDFPKPSCIQDIGQSALKECRFGAANGPLVVLFGDSHAQQWQPALQDLVGLRGWTLDVITHAGCAAAPVPQLHTPDMATCNEWRVSALARIQQLHPQLVIMSSFSKYLDPKTSRKPEWEKTIATIKADGAKIAYLVDSPVPPTDIPVCVSGHLDNWSACSFSEADAVWPDPVRADVALGVIKDVSVIDFTPTLCRNGRCPAVRAGVLFYRDNSHLSATLAKIMQPAMAAALDKYDLMPSTTASGASTPATSSTNGANHGG